MDFKKLFSIQMRTSLYTGFIILALVNIFWVSLTLVRRYPGKAVDCSQRIGFLIGKQLPCDSVPQGKWHLLPNKFGRLNENIIYKKFKIAKPKLVTDVNILLIVSSAPTRYERRNAIRETWWKQCRNMRRVSITCVFLTDKKNNTDPTGTMLEQESAKYGDIQFQTLSGGYDFGKRFLYHMVWAMENFNFDYFMRIDDDYFLCMNRFLLEVPMPPRKLYHWGWVHCIEDIVRPDESIILLSRDIIEKFLGQDPYTMLCNNWADQMIGVWKDVLQLPDFYRHDNRLHHQPPVQQTNLFNGVDNICHTYIGVHGSYPNDMRILWKRRGRGNGHIRGTSLDDFSDTCNLREYMNWKLFQYDWKTEPKHCKDDPDWGGYHGSAYIGREGYSNANDRFMELFSN